MKKNDTLQSSEDREKVDKNRDGIDDRIAPPPVDIGAGARELEERFRKNPNTNPILSGGDVDAQWEMAESSGEETVAGSAPTPGQSSVEDLAAAMGITYRDDEELKIGEKERQRDRSRWELDPASSEDYQERVKKEE